MIQQVILTFINARCKIECTFYMSFTVVDSTDARSLLPYACAIPRTPVARSSCQCVVVRMSLRGMLSENSHVRRSELLIRHIAPGPSLRCQPERHTYTSIFLSTRCPGLNASGPRVTDRTSESCELATNYFPLFH